MAFSRNATYCKDISQLTVIKPTDNDITPNQGITGTIITQEHKAQHNVNTGTNTTTTSEVDKIESDGKDTIPLTELTKSSVEDKIT
eukprot:8672644-Ditylum_brightwellii.AAC.2